MTRKAYFYIWDIDNQMEIPNGRFSSEKEAVDAMNELHENLGWNRLQVCDQSDALVAELDDDGDDEDEDA